MALTLRVYHAGGKKTDRSGNKYDVVEDEFYFSAAELPPCFAGATRFVLTADVGEMKGVGGNYYEVRTARGHHTGLWVQVESPRPGARTPVSYGDVVELYLMMLDEARASGYLRKQRLARTDEERRRGGRGDPPRTDRRPSDVPSSPDRPVTATPATVVGQHPAAPAVAPPQQGSLTVYHVVSGALRIDGPPSQIGRINGETLAAAILPGVRAGSRNGATVEPATPAEPETEEPAAATEAETEAEPVAVAAPAAATPAILRSARPTPANAVPAQPAVGTPVWTSQSPVLT
jgi:hypothetical protein